MDETMRFNDQVRGWIHEEVMTASDSVLKEIRILVRVVERLIKNDEAIASKLDNVANDCNRLASRLGAYMLNGDMVERKLDKFISIISPTLSDAVDDAAPTPPRK